MSSFKIGFNIEDYQDILPNPTEYLKHDVIINNKEWNDGNLDECIWRRPADAIDKYPSKAVKAREIVRILKTGVWIMIKDQPIWIPPNYYFFLTYFNAGGMPPQFRLKRLKHVYFKIGVRNNPRALGTYTVKNRQDGETTIAMSDSLWEVMDGNMDFGQIGIQSKTRDTVVRSCWRNLIMGWNGIPQWLKGELFSDFTSGERVAEAMKFMRQHTPMQDARDILISFGASTHNAFDSYNNMRRCVLDEVNKWLECSFYQTYLNYEKFIAAGSSRKGLFDIFSSPADTNGKHNDEAYQFWKDSNPNELEDGTTKSRCFRYYSNPLDGAEGMYDKFGDADPDEILAWIKRKRKNTPKEHLMSEVRAYPLNESEMFEATDSGYGVLDNEEGIKARRIYLIGRRFKDNTQEPIKVYGNLERVDGFVDGDVQFRMADVDHFDVDRARFCFSYIPQDKEPLQTVFKPPEYVENCLGVDPYARRHTKEKKRSNGAMVNRKFRDIYETGINKCPTMIYCNRPQSEIIFYEDVIKAAIFNRARIQYENITAGLGEYIEDRGYFDWLLPTKGQREGSKLTGDSPSGKGGFFEEGLGLLNAATNLPILATDPYHLELHWFDELLEDYLKLNPKDTHEQDLTMADIQALVGIAKLLHQEKRLPSEITGRLLSYLLED